MLGTDPSGTIVPAVIIGAAAIGAVTNAASYFVTNMYFANSLRKFFKQLTLNNDSVTSYKNVSFHNETSLTFLH